MFKPLKNHLPLAKELGLLVGRLLLAAIFLHEGLSLISNFDSAAEGMLKIGVPIPALMATVVLQLGASLAIVLGFYTRLGAAGLSLFCVATALLFHNHVEIRNELLHFEKDLAIAGGMLVLMINGPGRWALAPGT